MSPRAKEKTKKKATRKPAKKKTVRTKTKPKKSKAKKKKKKKVKKAAQKTRTKATNRMKRRVVKKKVRKATQRKKKAVSRAKVRKVEKKRDTKAKKKKVARKATPVAKKKQITKQLRSESKTNRIRICKELDCPTQSTTQGFCRLHYITNWKQIKADHKQKKERKLNRYVERMMEQHGRKAAKAIRKDISNGKVDGQDAFLEDEVEEYVDAVSRPENISKILDGLKVEE